VSVVGAVRAWVTGVLLLVGCTKGPEEPVDPVWGKQPCAHCRMLVSERAPAAQLTLADGTRHYFDDVGCMVSLVERERLSPRHQWVRSGEAWVPAESTRYASGVPTPMGYGFLPAAQGVGWEQVREAVRARNAAGGAPR
jgi:copper chaperone NosL